MHLRLYIDRLEQFSLHCGATVIRDSLAGVLIFKRQFLTLAHDLTHLIAHCNASPRLNRTVCEYEAEAVERWVGAELKVPPYAEERLDAASLTDDLLACSVVRVRWVARTLVSAARDGVSAAVERARLQA
jgi:hypothetical protein